MKLKSVSRKYFRYGIRLLRREASLKRAMNRIMIERAFKARTEVVRGYPIYAYIDVCNICNLKCPLCPTGQGRNERLKGKMSLEDFKRIIDEIGDYLYVVRLDSWGEPLLNREIFDMIAYAKKKRISVNFSTNFNIFCPEMAEEMVRSDLDELYVSLDGVTQKTYETYRRGGNLKRVIENILLLQKVKRKENSPVPRIVLKFMVMRHNEYELVQAKELANRLQVEQFMQGAMHVDMGKSLDEDISSSIAKDFDWLPRNESLSRYDYEKKKVKRKIDCDWSWKGVAINWDGSVSPCCAVYEKRDDFGNIFEQGFQAIWNGNQYRASRSWLSKRSFPVHRTVCYRCSQHGFLG